jgi:hypothetical protein
VSDVLRYCYDACGLSVVSDAPIAGLRRAADVGTPDVTVTVEGSATGACRHEDYPRLCYVSPETDASGRPEIRLDAGEDGYRLTFGGAATFLVDTSGAHVIVRSPPTSPDVDAAGYLTGSVLAFLLRVRGSVPLHASAVATGDRALVFVGDSWSGKSSTAAAFATLGYSLVSDDIVRFETCGDDLVAFPYMPRLSVWGDSAAALFGAADRDAYRKRLVGASDGGYRFQVTPVPIAAVYVLTERAAGRSGPIVGRLPLPDALITLLRHTHGRCFLDSHMRAREFEMLARLVTRVPVAELTFGDSLDDLLESCRALHNV